jgi:hypothetical protein
MSDPYVIEMQINALLKDRRDWVSGKKYTTCNRETFHKKMQEVYSYLHTSSASLFNRTVSGEMDSQKAQAQIKYMLDILKQVHNGKLTQDNADKVFGTEMHTKYVKPVVDKLDAETPPTTDN